MQKFTTIDCVCALNWGLTVQEAYLFAWFYRLPSWASTVIIEGKIYYFASKNKAIEDLPLLTDKVDTMYRYYTAIKQKGLIEVKKIEDKDYIKLTEKALDWQSDRSEKNPSNNGKKSEQGSEKNPTYRKKKNTDSKTDSKPLNTGEFSENENSVFGSETIVKPLVVGENQKPVETPAGEPGKEGEAGGRPAGAEKPKKEKVKLTNPVPVYPENWATATKQAFDEWLEYRILIKKPYLEVSLKTQLKKLNVFDQATIIETIEESIAQGWRGLFPKVNKDTAKPKKQSLNELSLEILKENLEKIGYNGTEPIHPSLREWDGNE